MVLLQQNVVGQVKSCNNSGEFEGIAWQEMSPLGSLSEKNTGFFGSFSHTGGEGSPKSQNFCDLTK